MALKHKIREETETIRRSEEWSGEIEGYDVFATQDRLGHFRLSLAPASWNGDRLRMGIFQSCPKSVSELEAFAEDSKRVLYGIARALRGMGKDDLRAKYEIDLERDTKEIEALMRESTSR